MTPDDEAGDDPRALELALRIADDAPVDWEATRESASDLDSTLETLRQLQSVGELHRRRENTTRERATFVWGPLRAVERLGQGAFGEVWRAWDSSLEREVALKLHRAGEPASRSTRWLREAQRLARVRHEHVLTVHGTDLHEGRAGIWTELIRGRTLEEILFTQGPMGARELVALGLDLCAALAAVHDAGLIHGDVKTRNVMREGSAGGNSAAGSGRIVLMDFGAASRTDTAGLNDGPSGATPLFAAPELLEGESASTRSDLYALGVLLYRMASGHAPIEAISLDDLRARHARSERTPLRNWRPDLPGALVQVIERALEPAASRRFADAGEMERALAGVHAPPAPPTLGRVSLRRQLALMGSGAVLTAAVWAAMTYLPGLLAPRYVVHPVGVAAASRLVQSVPGHENLGMLGFSVASPGDVDGDGYPDLLVAAPGEQNPSGRVRLMRGTADGTFVEWRSFGGPGGSFFGYRVAGIGDVNGDHHPDFAIGAIYADHAGVPRTGEVFIYLGGPEPDSLPALELGSPRASAEFGFDIESAGDVNHDGFADFLVSAPTDGRDGAASGRVYLYLGRPHLSATPDLELIPNRVGTQFGISATGIGDVNGDGYDDFAVGANTDGTAGRVAGKAYIYLGGAHPDGDPDLQLYAAGPGDWYGCCIRGIGDVNGDGIDDYAVAAERAMGFEEWGGTVSVYLGGQNLDAHARYVLRGKGSNSKFGHVFTACDVNGDGHPDILVGAYGDGSDGPVRGSISVFYGGPQMDDTPDLHMVGPSKIGNFGTDLATIPGLGGPGVPGLVVGAPETQPGGQFLVYQFPRYAISNPVHAAHWPREGGSLTWTGPELADIEWAPAIEGPWAKLATRVGGKAQNSLHIALPDAARDSLRLRLRPSDSHVPGQAMSAPIMLDAGR